MQLQMDLPSLLSLLFSSQAIGTGNDICRLLTKVPIIPFVIVNWYNHSDSSVQASITWDLLTTSIHHFLMQGNVYQAVRWERELVLQFALHDYHSECIEYCLLSLTHDLPTLVSHGQQVMNMLLDVKEHVENYSLLACLIPILNYFIVC